MTRVVDVNPSSIVLEGNRIAFKNSQVTADLKLAADTLKNDEVVAFPTETVYGLGANCQSTEAVSKIFKAKNRPADNPLIIHVSSLHQITQVLKTEIPPIYNCLIKKFWPGPLTIILPLSSMSPISELCTKGQHTFGCRMPAHPVARALIELSGLPVAAPSANTSTRPSCTEAKHVLEDMNDRIPLILDGGPAQVGVESTVVDGLVSPPRILRPGGVSLEDIKEFGGPDWENTISEVSSSIPSGVSVRSPGMKYKHYSPKAQVILVDPKFDKQKLAQHFSPKKPAILCSMLLSEQDFVGIWPGAEIITLPLGRTKPEVSHYLFSRFREADQAEADLIIVEAVDTKDEGLAIMNRLNKAAEIYIKQDQC